jgi:hypothetical protein
MRLWTIHPKYLDARGLVAAWREGLLAKKVLEGKTKGYSRHPQLERFSASQDPLESINQYLWIIYEESVARNYHFDKTKITRSGKAPVTIPVSSGQVAYEYELLKYKLQKRDVRAYMQLQDVRQIEVHPVFCTTSGTIENWEKVMPEIARRVAGTQAGVDN